MRRRDLVPTLAALSLSATSARAAGTGHRYAVMSFVADYLTVTGFESTTGALTRSNPTERIDLQTDELERVVVRSAVRALNETALGQAVALLSDDGRLYAEQSRMIDGDSVRLPPFMLQTLREQQATHLMLVTKHAAPARMRAADTDLGSGRVEGLGFYVDRVTALKLRGAGDVTVGYLAPHAYLRLSLVNLQNLRVLDSETMTASRVITAARTDAGNNPWDIMDSAGKLQALSELITESAAPVWRGMLKT